MTKFKNNYNIGLDIGTSSVGWAVVDNDYSILKHKGKNMWGVRLFEEGETAVKRRVARSTRRRIQRRKTRISLLKELIAPTILKEDPNFFMRMEKGYQSIQDKGYEYNLFIEESFTDKDYFNKFQTIYHLRKYLCEANEKVDARLLYLALHHIIKYRGNFLYEGQTFELSNNVQVRNDLKMAIKTIIDTHNLAVDCSDGFISSILELLMNTSEKRGFKKDKCIEKFSEQDKDAKKIAMECINVLLGYDTNLTRLFPSANIQKDDKDYTTNFSSTKYGDDIDFIESSLSEDFEVLAALHRVYSFLILQDVMNAKDMLSDAMIEKYENHEKDLRELKVFVKKHYGLQVYNEIFRDKNKIGNYYAYINEPKSTSKKELYDFIKKTLSLNEEAVLTITFKDIMNKIEMDNYLLKQNSKDNGAIPYQLHEMELLKILDNQGKYYSEIDANKDKILSLFKFRVPYYVGPLHKDSEFSWFVRKEDGVIRPWNFDEKVDTIESAENFIRKMTNNCTYLLTEPVVAKKSLLYSRYEVLNELNKIRINGKLIEVDLKKEILNDVFMQKKKVKSDDIKEFYIRKQYCDQADAIEVKGFQKENEFASSLEPWIDFKNIYGSDFDSHYDEIEQIIEWISVYEDKKILKKRIDKEYPNMDSEKLKQILKKKYKGWGRFSKELLLGLSTTDAFENKVNIMDCLENSKMNFMQLINDKQLKFSDLIEKKNNLDNENGVISYEQVSQLQGSPAIKKGIWQTLKIVEELKEFMGYEPENIFIEFARSDEDKKRTMSKVKRLQDIYADIKKNNEMLGELTKVHSYLSKEDKNAKLDNERLYLYYIQQGKCMYSGRTLDLSLLSSYQVDHIIPQSYIKDDSIENKVLVYSNENQYKGDKLLVSQETIRSQYAWWKHLHKYRLIGDKKFKNLTRSSLSEMEEIQFINRQLVETRQITKHVANIFKNVYKEATVVSIKAGLSHGFREKFDLYKVREINDYHHAQDAYLASVLGTFVMKKYSTLKKEFIFTEYNQVKNFNKDLSPMATKPRNYGFILNQLHNELSFNEETGECVWCGEESIKKVMAVFNYKDCFITKKVEERHGQLFNLTINKKEEMMSTIEKTPHKIVPVNKGRADILQYGGFMNLEYAYAVAVEYPYKKKVKRTILNVPKFLANGKKEDLLTYLKAETKSDELTIIKDKILFNQLMEIGGGLYFMASASEWNNARQLILSKQSVKILYELFDEKTKDPSDEEILCVYDEYLEKLKLHYPLFENIHAKFILERDNFFVSTLKAKTLKEMLKITKANPSFAVLTNDTINISSSAGRIYNKTISLEDTLFLHQSITGLYTKKYKL